MKMYPDNVSWPEKSGEYKVIQILEEKEEEPFLRFSGRLEGKVVNQWHKDIVKGFAKEIGVQCGERKSCEGNWMIPMLPDSIEYQIVGMGKCYVSVESEIAAFYGNSRDYGVEINKKHLKLMRDFSAKKLFIEVGK